MPEAILCPQVGQDLTEAKVVALHVKLGDTVKKGQIVAEVESEKATFDVEAFATGVVVELPYQVGDNATVLQPLVVLGGADDAKPKAPKKDACPAPVQSVPANGKLESVKATPANGASRASPLARRLASTGGLDVGRIAGSGPQGAVVMRDVEAVLVKSGKNTSVATARTASGLNVKTLRDGVGVPLVFIHGFGAEIAAWKQLAMTLAVKNPLLGIDLPGHGASPDAGAPGFDGLVEAVAQTLPGIGGEVHLVGHSLGAAIAIAAAAQAGLTVKSLTLISPAGLGAFVDGGFVAGFLSAKSEAALAQHMRKLVANPASLPASMVRATQAAREVGGGADRQARIAANIFEGSTQLFTVRADLAAYSGPCKVIVGRKDQIISSKETEEALPAHAAFHRIENAGHLPFIEEAGLVARLVADNVRAGG